MAAAFLIKGLILGFSIAAPVGPIGILCIRRSLSFGRSHGLLTGLGAATADMLYGAIAGFGLKQLSDFLVGHEMAIRLIGAVFLAYLGARIFFAKPPPARETKAQPGSLLSSYGSSLVLTLTNPMTILSFVAAFAGLGLANASGDVLSSLFMVAGVFFGSAVWWLILSTLTAKMKQMMTSGVMAGINRLSGVLLFAFAVAAVVSLRS